MRRRVLDMFTAVELMYYYCRGVGQQRDTFRVIQSAAKLKALHLKAAKCSATWAKTNKSRRAFRLWTSCNVITALPNDKGDTRWGWGRGGDTFYCTYPTRKIEKKANIKSVNMAAAVTAPLYRQKKSKG